MVRRASLLVWLFRAVLALLLCLAASTCASSESHLGKTKAFLSECSVDAPCADSEQSCFCFCTVTCESSDPCLAELERLGLSVDPTRIACRAPSCEAAGDGAAGDVTGVCDVSCASDEDCGIFSDEHRCLGGFCRLEDTAAAPGAGNCPSDMAFVAGDEASGLADFCLDRYEVTVFGYEACEMAGQCTAPVEGNFHEMYTDDHPIQFVSPADADAYCAFAGRRLPALVEWQWAARNGSASDDYPWGNEAPTGSDVPPRVCALSGETHTCSIASRPAGDSAAGIGDLSGNVAELVEGEQVCGGGYTATTAEELSPTSCAPFVMAAGEIGFRCVSAPEP
jgi:hypothetical protein